MGVLPSTQPVATLDSTFILSSFDLAYTYQVLRVEENCIDKDGVPTEFLKNS